MNTDKKKNIYLTLYSLSVDIRGKKTLK